MLEWMGSMGSRLLRRARAQEGGERMVQRAGGSAVSRFDNHEKSTAAKTVLLCGPRARERGREGERGEGGKAFEPELTGWEECRDEAGWPNERCNAVNCVKCGWPYLISLLCL